jgi:HlyD family secretion protein
MPKNTALIRIKTAAASLGLLLAAACTQQQEKEPELIAPVQTAAVQRSSIQRIVRGQAILYPCDQAGVMPKISAPVRKFYVNRGDPVRKGQVLAELENRDLAAAALEAKGNYDQAEANYRNTAAAALPNEMAKAQSDVQSNKEALEAAQKVYESRKKLYEEGALARRLMDEAQVAYVQARNQYEISSKQMESLQQVSQETQLRAAKAQVEAAKGHEEGAGAQLQYSIISSPIDGVIAERPFYVGEIASAGVPLLIVMDISSVVARANIPINELDFLKAGEKAMVLSPDLSDELEGKVVIVSPALDPNSTTAEVWVRIDNPGKRLRPGASVQVRIIAATIPEALVIPNSALLPAQERNSDKVFIVGPDSLAHERKIEVGVREMDRVQVLKGLTLGEQVITVGGFGLQDKTRVRVENEPKEKNDRHDESKSPK